MFDEAYTLSTVRALSVLSQGKQRERGRDGSYLSTVRALSVLSEVFSAASEEEEEVSVQGRQFRADSQFKLIYTQYTFRANS